MDRTRESALRAERRLLGVLRRARFEIRSGRWTFEEIGGLDVARPEAIAVVRHHRTWSQLAPLPDDGCAAEPLRVWTFEFPPEEPNSGFVGWLASRIKEETGAGVLVVCGYDSSRGGIYDHWGCREEDAPDVLALLVRLRGGERDDASLDDRWMNVIRTASNGVVDHRTTFHFRQRGDRVWARYEGGEIQRGFLCGRREGDMLDFRYTQIQRDGVLDGGKSRCRVETGEDGRLRLVERFQWASREGAGENVFAELAGP